jgi:hypothetical protein
VLIGVLLKWSLERGKISFGYVKSTRGRELDGTHVLNESVERGDNSGRVKGGHLHRNLLV